MARHSAKTEKQAYELLYSKYPNFFPARATRESLLASIREAIYIITLFVGDPSKVPNKFYYSRNLRLWINTIKPELEAMGLHVEKNKFLPNDQVMILVDVPDAGKIDKDGDEWLVIFEDFSWSHGLKICDVFFGGEVEDDDEDDHENHYGR